MLSFSLNSQGFGDRFSKQISVATNDSDHPAVSLKCTGRILMPLTVTPNRVNFGRLTRNGPVAKQVVSIRRKDADSILPKLLPPRRPSGLDATLCEIEPGEHYELQLSLDHPRPPGNFSDVITIETGHEHVAQMHVVVSGEVVPRLALSPTHLQFPPKRERPIDQTLSLQWDNGIPAKILTAETTFPNATVSVQKRHERQIIVVTLPTGEDAPPGHHALTFTTDDPEVPSQTVPIRFDSPRRSRRAAEVRSSRDVAEGIQRVTPLKTRRQPVEKEEPH